MQNPALFGLEEAIVSISRMNTKIDYTFLGPLPWETAKRIPENRNGLNSTFRFTVQRRDFFHGLVIDFPCITCPIMLRARAVHNNSCNEGFRLPLRKMKGFGSERATSSPAKPFSLIASCCLVKFAKGRGLFSSGPVDLQPSSWNLRRIS